MSRWLVLAGFFTVFSILAIGLHLYVYRRLFRDPLADTKWVRRGRIILICGLLLLLVGMPSVRFTSGMASRALGYMCFGWMGVMAVLVPILWVSEVIRVSG